MTLVTRARGAQETPTPMTAQLNGEMSDERGRIRAMKFSNGELGSDRLIRALAAVGGCAIFVASVLATIKLIAWLQASASPFSTLDAAIAACRLPGGWDQCELILPG